jgi:hypothetical protein
MTEPVTLQAAKMTYLALALIGLAAGCGPRPAAAVNAAATPAAPPDYRPAPELLGGGTAADGRLQLIGSAVPGAVVRLYSPGGAQQFATADDHGRWRFTLAPSNAPRLLSLAMSDNGRVVQAMEYLFVAPNGVVARLRSGGGTQAPARGQAGLAALALDYDNQRAATLSGVAGPHESVTVRIDGVERSQGAADSAGRFVLALQPLAAGAHEFDLMGAAQEIHFSAKVDSPAPLGKATYAAQKAGQGWRIDWVTPGGGEQTTLILGPSEAGA